MAFESDMVSGCNAQIAFIAGRHNKQFRATVIGAIRPSSDYASAIVFPRRSAILEKKSHWIGLDVGNAFAAWHAAGGAIVPNKSVYAHPWSR
jgi:hypothetical protein